ncbi:MAG TPA: hypothetical protein VNN19_10085 [bacterium]|nr:hypothetical protein [bacterium]
MAGEIQSASFVVRLRVDPSERRRWWGEAQRVETGERIAFRDQAKLLEFLQRHLRELEDTR